MFVCFKNFLHVFLIAKINNHSIKNILCKYGFISIAADRLFWCLFHQLRRNVVLQIRMLTKWMISSHHCVPRIDKHDALCYFIRYGQDVRILSLSALWDPECASLSVQLVDLQLSILSWTLLEVIVQFIVFVWI